jgi:predicted dehydrogenase
MSAPDRIVVVGSGAYVIGDTYGPGVVLRSILAWLDGRGRAGEVVLTARTKARRAAAARGAADATADLASKTPVSVVAADDVDALIAKRPLAVFVCVPDQAHQHYVEAAARAEVPAWLVKPVTGDLATARVLEASCRAKGAAVWVDYHKRFDTSNQLLRQSVERAEHGRPLHYFVQYSQPRDLPMQQFAWAADVDPLTYIGCHYLDQLAFVFPGVVAERAMAIAIDGPVRHAVGGRAHDKVICEVALRYKNQPLHASLHVGWANPLGAPAKSFQRVELDLEHGKVVADQTARGYQVWTDAGTREVNPYFFQRLADPATGAPTVSGYGYDSVARFLDYCVAGADEQRRLRASATLPWIEHAVFAERVLAAATASMAAGGRWVDIAS